MPIDSEKFIKKLSKKEQRKARLYLDVYGVAYIGHDITTDAYTLINKVDIIQLKKNE